MGLGGWGRHIQSRVGRPAATLIRRHITVQYVLVLDETCGVLFRQGLGADVWR